MPCYSHATRWDLYTCHLAATTLHKNVGGECWGCAACPHGTRNYADWLVQQKIWLVLVVPRRPPIMHSTRCQLDMKRTIVVLRTVHCYIKTGRIRKWYRWNYISANVRWSYNWVIMMENRILWEQKVNKLTWGKLCKFSCTHTYSRAYCVRVFWAFLMTPDKLLFGVHNLLWWKSWPLYFYWEIRNDQRL